MNRPSLKCLLMGVLVVVALAATAPQADAFWHGGHGCCYSACYWPCYSSCYWPCYSSCYSGCGSCGYRGWGCGGCGYRSVGCCGSYVTDCCTTTDSCCNGGTGGAMAPTPAAPTPAPAKMPAVEQPAPAAPAPAMPPPPKTSATSPDESGVLTVWVPYDAKVTVNGQATQSKGSRRQFISYGLKSGLSYKYVVKAEVVRNGEVQEDTRTVVLTAGDATAVAFGFNATQQVAAAQ
jgi:uncharacterized protein (TIGR03000 family)